jgi:AcrR family transcriptional regulator
VDVARAQTRRSPKGDLARERIVASAEVLFSERGLFGTSVRDVAQASEIPTASLLHHFPTKERLYGAVLAAIAADLQVVLSPIAKGKALPRVRQVAERFIDWCEEHPERSNLLLRELLDNPSRLDAAEQLHLKPAVERFAALVEEGVRAGEIEAVDPFLFVVHLAGAASYFSAARPTLEKILGPKKKKGLAKRHKQELMAMVDRALLGKKS